MKGVGWQCKHMHERRCLAILAKNVNLVDMDILSASTIPKGLVCHGIQQEHMLVEPWKVDHVVERRIQVFDLMISCNM